MEQVVLANLTDARCFRRWKHSLSHYACKECNGDRYETINKPSLMHHITRLILIYHALDVKKYYIFLK